MPHSKLDRWLLELERERLDSSWRRPPTFDRYAPTERPIATKQRLKTEVRKDASKQQRERDKIMFHAGRYAEGARDDEAVQAHLQVPNLINERKR